MNDSHLSHVERMMTPLRSSVVGALAMAALGCHGNAVTNSQIVAMAAIHFVNAVPDTGQMDYRVVDIASNASLFDADFRSFNSIYKGIEAGTREIRVFNSSTDPAISSQVLWDTTFAFTQDQGYTFVHTGFARVADQPPVRTVWIIPDTPPTPAAAQVGLRFIHAGAGIGPVDVNFLRKGSDTLPDTPLFANVAYGSAATYSLMPHDSFTVTTTSTAVTFTYYDTLRVVVTATGTKTPLLFAATVAPLGIPGYRDPLTQEDLNPVPGTAVPGTVLTALLVPRSVVGSPAVQFATPTVLYFVDKRPPNTAP